MGNQGLANHRFPLVGAGAVREVTPGVTEWSRARAHIDPAVCCSDVGSRYPGRAQAAKGRVVHPLKPHVSWVKYGASQYGYYLSGVLAA